MLHLTSLLFGTNAVHALFRDKIFYAGLFILLMTTSILWHSSPKLEEGFMPIFWLDQAAIASIIAMSLYYVSQMQFSWILLGLIGAIAGLGYHLCYACTWDKSYPIEHGCLHSLVSATFHVILCSF